MSAAVETSGVTIEVNTNEKSDGDGSMMIDDGTNIEPTLLRLTLGLPKRELRMITQESIECESFLLDDIRVLEQALIVVEGKEEENEALLSTILESPLTPLDRYWTVSALLGRLRQEMATKKLDRARWRRGVGLRVRFAAADPLREGRGGVDQRSARVLRSRLLLIVVALPGALVSQPARQAGASTSGSAAA